MLWWNEMLIIKIFAFAFVRSIGLKQEWSAVPS